MSNLVASVVQKTQQMTKVAALPTIKTRTKKLEAEEQAKRARRMDQQKRQQDSSSSSSSSSGGGSGGTGGGGYFSANDGSADGRKADRERRREEHRKSNPNYREKTPEEIAEIERLRRKRMEEEADKWNMAPEDMPDEGEPVDDGYYMEEEDYGDDADNDGEEGDGEDVMDLD
jgi:hypothetical protein